MPSSVQSLSGRTTRQSAERSLEESSRTLDRPTDLLQRPLQLIGTNQYHRRALCGHPQTRGAASL